MRRLLAIDVARPAAVSSIFLSNKGKIILVAVVTDSGEDNTTGDMFVCYISILSTYYTIEMILSSYSRTPNE
jgi:hypothetical protein